MEFVTETVSQAGFSPLEWILLALIVIGLPIEGEVALKILKPRILSGEPRARRFTYLYTMAVLWTLTLLILIGWAMSGQNWADLGFQFVPNLQTWAACGVCALIIGFFLMQLFLVHTRETIRAQYREALKGPREGLYFLPTTRREYRTFHALSLTAGITEEVIFRGFLIWALAMLFPLWAAALISMVVFIFLHRYQGAVGMTQVSVAAAVLTGLYLLSGSLYPVIILHIALDMIQNATLWRARQDLHGDDIEAMTAHG